jgi:hypothetical protein
MAHKHLCRECDAVIASNVECDEFDFDHHRGLCPSCTIIEQHGLFFYGMLAMRYKPAIDPNTNDIYWPAWQVEQVRRELGK